MLDLRTTRYRSLLLRTGARGLQSNPPHQTAHQEQNRPGALRATAAAGARSLVGVEQSPGLRHLMGQFAVDWGGRGNTRSGPARYTRLRSNVRRRRGTSGEPGEQGDQGDQGRRGTREEGDQGRRGNRKTGGAGEQGSSWGPGEQLGDQGSSWRTRRAGGGPGEQVGEQAGNQKSSWGDREHLWAPKDTRCVH